MTDKTINILSAKLIGEYRIRLLFDDGTAQEVDFKPFLTHSHHPDIRAYLDPALFAGFKVEYGDLVWGDYDLCFPIADLYLNTIIHYESLTSAA